MDFIDTHSHLYDEQFVDDIDEVLQRAFASGASKIFLPNINEETVLPMLKLMSNYPDRLYPMIGLHPEDITDSWRKILMLMERLLQVSSHPFIAIGEVGLDYYWDRSRYEEQQKAFAIQVDWAVKYDLPLMIHTRDAHEEMVEIMKSSTRQISNRHLSGVFHCFGGTAEEAEELLSFDGFMLGIGGVVTYKKSPLPEVLREVVPLDRIVLETDSPYLAPVPYRGKRNETSYLLEVIRKLAEIYSCEECEVAEKTTKNALKTFPKAR